MGLILDSSVLIGAERKGQTARQALIGIGSRVGEEDVAISVVTLTELAHGVARAETEQRRAARQQFLNELTIALPVHAVSVAWRCGSMESLRRKAFGFFGMDAIVQSHVSKSRRGHLTLNTFKEDICGPPAHPPTTSPLLTRGEMH